MTFLDFLVRSHHQDIAVYSILMTICLSCCVFALFNLLFQHLLFGVLRAG